MMQVQAGAGGTESMDWAAMIMNMYKMWARQRGYKVTVVDEMPGEIAGIKVNFPNFQCLILFCRAKKCFDIVHGLDYAFSQCNNEQSCLLPKELPIKPAE